ncbi:MAG TPA: DoxX family protein [Planctomycetota bacterium]|nr:DoxX family protein [Planctomycetota bacterium]HRR79419.1 DoxX family protein [Planctomycetota bacterium]HRT95689.1 DoxX family protein [Planctomycetota bacterium]
MQSVMFTLLRIAIGWHFLYEGLVKLADPAWSAAGYLQNAQGPLAGAFQAIAASPAALKAVNAANVWGLTLVGAALMLGAFTRLAAAGGMLLLALYYAAYPPFFGAQAGPVEGHYLFINKNLVELLALAAVAATPRSLLLGLDQLAAALWRRRREAAPEPRPEAPRHEGPTDRELAKAVNPDPLGRRAVLANLIGVPAVGALVLAFLRKLGWRSREAETLAAHLAGKAPAQPKVDAVTSATIKSFQFPTLADLKGQVPHAKLGTLDLSRVILGGNHIGGWAHARDLIYVDALVKQYHHKWKVFETFALAEKCGVNAFLTNPVLCEIIKEYWDRGLGKIQFISDCGGSDLVTMAKKSVDFGAAACYVHGGMADAMAARKQFDQIGKVLDAIRALGVPAGVGGHKLATVKGCVEAGLKPDFWMKTLHHHRYWSGRDGKDECDNLWCDKPDETIAFMRERPEPWIAFKTLAAGAIRPQDAFRYALKNGADFLCVGMYDFQIVGDINIALEALAENQQRERPWRA